MYVRVTHFFSESLKLKKKKTLKYEVLISFVFVCLFYLFIYLFIYCSVFCFFKIDEK